MEQDLKHPTPSFNAIPDDDAHNQEIRIVMQSEVDAFQPTPLHLASKNGDIDTVRALLKNNTGACFVYDNDGFIPLHYAVINGQVDIMKELINATPQSIWMKLKDGFLNTTDDEGNTILDLSIKLRQSEMVGYLLSLSEVKTRVSTTSNVRKRSLESRNSKKQRRESASFRIGRWKAWRKKLKYKGDWVQEVQGTMMLVATVIATVTFQAGVNPAGGVWQEDTPDSATLKNGTIHRAGSAIMAYRLPVQHLVYSMANVVSFMASVSVILLIISRVPLKNRVCSWVLVLAMCAAVVFLALAFLQGFIMVNLKPLNDLPAAIGYYFALYFLFGLVGLVGLIHLIRFLVWVVNSLLCCFTSKFKAHSFKCIVS
ncbi:ankyrin repeat-containing protein At5g02620-like isoform X3 [Cucurbita pepo subsp. pepo]|uniref:ankyrin repeat-containing protein At5g02620-like isoform X3 n=1 Tax=Cucurbita pepo subsp. pepo TaxID=3664 RepID=UPI000C9D384A|nr:ankyrin repeat-containing protein At5g02620-like isoform X3 [Cucurbita pepo subsp. pepo]